MLGHTNTQSVFFIFLKVPLMNIRLSGSNIQTTYEVTNFINKLPIPGIVHLKKMYILADNVH